MRRSEPDTPGRRQRRFSWRGFAGGQQEARRELEDELAFHLEASRRELMASGLSETEARAEAERRFGDLDSVRRRCWDIDRRRLESERRGEIMSHLAADVTVALRGFAKHPIHALGILLTLALGIGGTTAIFSVVYGVLLAPLPLPAPERLVQLWEKNPDKGWMHNQAAPANFLDWKEGVSSFEGVTAYNYGSSELPFGDEGEAEMLAGWEVYGNFFSVLGVEPVLGRSFTEEDTWDAGEGRAVVSHDFWVRRLGADPEAAGREIRVAGRPVTVVGVAPEGFAFPSPEVDLWFPFAWQAPFREAVWFRRAHFVWPVGRLAAGATAEDAREELAVVAARLETEYPETNRVMGADLTPLHEWTVGEVERPLYVLLAAVMLVLLVATVNVAHLQLARSAARRRDLTVRAALGASRGRLVRQALVESLLLAVVGGAAGLALAGIALRVLLALAPDDLPRLAEVSINAPVAAFTVLVTSAVGLLFGLAPALSGARRALRPTLAAGGRTGSARLAGGRGLLLAAEIALAVVLVIGAGLLAKSFLRLARVDPGFDPEGAATFRVVLPSSFYPEVSDVVGFQDRLRREISALPGVGAVGISDALPLSGTNWTSDYSVRGRGEDDYGVEVSHRTVTPEYFAAMRVPLAAGRLFGAEDAADGPPVVVVNEAFAREAFPGSGPEGALGKEISFDKKPGEGTLWRRIVGVVGNERLEGLSSEPRTEIFQAMEQDPQRSIYVVVRSQAPPETLLPLLASTVESIDSALPVIEMAGLETIVSRSIVRERFLMVLMALFSALALALAAVGMYGVMAYGVARRRREIGIRMALGARLERVVGMIVKEGLAVVALGVAGGLAASYLLTRSLESLLFRVEARDPAVFLAVALLLTLVALLASYLPARRAGEVDPALTLREE